MMEKISLIDETFDRFRSESYNLSVEISMTGYKISITDAVRESVILLITSPFDIASSDRKDWTDIVQNLFVQHEMLARKFKNVYFSFESTLFTIIPSDIFMPERAKQLLETVHQLPDLYEVRFNHIRELNATVIYALPNSLTSKWIEKQPKTIFVGHPSPLIAMSTLAKWDKDEPFIQVQFADGFYTQAVSKNKELLNCNTFSLYNINDTAYHLINTTKLLGYDAEVSEINLTGSYVELGALQSLMNQYFKKVNGENLLHTHSFTYSIAKYKNIYWNLFNLNLCE